MPRRKAATNNRNTKRRRVNTRLDGDTRNEEKEEIDQKDEPIINEHNQPPPSQQQPPSYQEQPPLQQPLQQPPLQQPRLQQQPRQQRQQQARNINRNPEVNMMLNNILLDNNNNGQGSYLGQGLGISAQPPAPGPSQGQILTGLQGPILPGLQGPILHGLHSNVAAPTVVGVGGNGYNMGVNYLLGTNNDRVNDVYNLGINYGSAKPLKMVENIGALSYLNEISVIGVFDNPIHVSNILSVVSSKKKMKSIDDVKISDVVGMGQAGVIWSMVVCGAFSLGNLDNIRNTVAGLEDGLGKDICNELLLKLTRVGDVLQAVKKISTWLLISDDIGKKILQDRIIGLSKVELLELSSNMKEFMFDLDNHMKDYVSGFWRAGRRTMHSYGTHGYNNYGNNYMNKNGYNKSRNGYNGNFNRGLFDKCKKLGLCYNFVMGMCNVVGCKFDHKKIDDQKADTKKDEDKKDS